MLRVGIEVGIEGVRIIDRVKEKSVYSLLFNRLFIFQDSYWHPIVQTLARGLAAHLRVSKI